METLEAEANERLVLTDEFLEQDRAGTSRGKFLLSEIKQVEVKEQVRKKHIVFGEKQNFAQLLITGPTAVMAVVLMGPDSHEKARAFAAKIRAAVNAAPSQGS